MFGRRRGQGGPEAGDGDRGGGGVGDDRRGGMHVDVEGDPEDAGRRGVDEAVAVVVAQSPDGEEHEDRGGSVEAVVAEEEVVHAGKIGVGEAEGAG